MESPMDYFKKGMEMYESSLASKSLPPTPPPTPIASPVEEPKKRKRKVKETPVEVPVPQEVPTKGKAKRKVKETPKVAESEPARKPAASVWRETLKMHREKHGLKGIPRKGTPEHAKVIKDYEKALRKAAKQRK